MSEPHPRLGFCCKFIPENGDAEATRRMSAVIAHNVEALRNQVDHVAQRPPLERLLRVISSVLPGYTHPSCQNFYRDPDLRRLIERGLAAVGEAARAGGVRLSMHPSQFCVLATASESAAQNALGELEYHAEVMALMGYGGGWHPHGAHSNVHGGARAPGIAGFRVNFARLSETARDLVTVENDEVSYGLDDLLPLGDTLPIVLDIYHHWIASRGEYIQPSDPRIARVIASWRGVRPVSHISEPREELLPDHDIYALPDFAALTASGIKAKDLRAHSDLMWNEAVNDLVADHLVWTDFEVEAKFKNIASEGLARHVEQRRERRVAAE